MLPKEFVNPYPAYLEAAKLLLKNPGQIAAYESKGNCAILAGPGSGKTKTLTIKMARLLHEEIKPPQGIACITYSTECARELKQRLDLLGIHPKKNVFIGTIHGFCLNHVVRPYARLAGIEIPDPIVVPDNETWMTFFERAAFKAGVREDPTYMRSRVENYRRTYLDRASREWREKDSETANVIEIFEESLHNEGYLDFDDMVLLGLRIIEQSDWVKRALKARFPVLVIDEYQDLGLPLHRIVLQLYQQAGVRIIAVGDPDQSIFGFAGANPQLLRELAELPNIETISLQMNYRCAKTIVVGSMVALGEERDYAAAGDYDGTIKRWECPNGIEEQAETICKVIIPEALNAREGRTLGDIAVLYHDRYDAAVITAAARANGYKYVGGDKDIRYKATPLTHWLEDCAAWSAGGWKIGVPTLSTLIDFWIGLNGAPQLLKERKHLRQILVDFLWGHRDPTERLKDWLDGILAAGLSSMVDKYAELEEKKSLEGLYSAAADPQKLGDLDIAAFGKLRGSSDHLNLVTLHSSKGLEFEVVIIMGMDQGRIPKWRATGPEPRRLFYVGLTRAKHEVHLVYSGWYNDRYGRRRENGPSQFLLELKNRMDERQELESIKE